MIANDPYAELETVAAQAQPPDHAVIAREELELRLKREYATVFGMFRYCVLTAEATYLCNRLNIEHANTAA